MFFFLYIFCSARTLHVKKQQILTFGNIKYLFALKLTIDDYQTSCTSFSLNLPLDLLSQFQPRWLISAPCYLNIPLPLFFFYLGWNQKCKAHRFLSGAWRSFPGEKKSFRRNAVGEKKAFQAHDDKSDTSGELLFPSSRLSQQTLQIEKRKRGTYQNRIRLIY